MVVTFAYMRTPLIIIMSMMLIAVMYTLSKGIEVLVRTGELYFVILTLVGVIVFTLILVSGKVDMNNLRPVLEEGWWKVLRASLAGSMVFPFGEVIVFSMLLPYVDKPQKIKSTILTALVISGLVLAFCMVISISVLGVDIFTRAVYPLLITVQMIEGAGFLERLDVFFMVTTVLGGFFRISIFYYAGVIGASNLFGVKDYRKLIYPVGITLLFVATMLTSNYVEFVYKGLRVYRYYFQIPVLVMLPIALLLVAFIRNRKKKGLGKQNRSTS